MLTLKELIKRSEERYIDYKKQIEDAHRNKDQYNKVDPELFESFKLLLRDLKNSEEKWLKGLVEEKKFENEGLNPPFCYKHTVTTTLKEFFR